MFEGEYFNGKKWNGKGRGYEYTDLYEYDYISSLIFEGEYLNGEKNW